MAEGSDSWMERLREATRGSELLQKDIFERNRDLETTGVVSASTNASVRKAFSALERSLSLLTNEVNQADDNEVLPQEKQRRRDMLKNLVNKKNFLQGQLSRGPSGAGSPARAKLLEGHGARQGHIGGKNIKEKEQELGIGDIDNAGIVSMQKTMMQSQDDALERIFQTVKLQKELGTTIHEELVEQDRLLDSLDESVDLVTGRLKRNTRLVDKLGIEGSSSKYLCTIFILSGIVVALVVLLKT